MKANELRIGNYISTLYMTSGIFNVTEITRVYCYFENTIQDFKSYTTYQYIKPIPLTEEWLLKFGFTVYKHGAELGNFSLLKLLNPTVYNCLGVKLKYVHQLQNLYFALKQEELTTK